MSLLRSLVLPLAVLLASCVSPPRTPEESFRETRLVGQPDGSVLVIGQEIPFTIRQTRGYTGFQALVEPRKITYYQKTNLAGLGDRGIFEVSRAQLERFRASGTSVSIIDSSVRVSFSPPYIEGFLRRVDSVAGSRGLRRR